MRRQASRGMRCGNGGPEQVLQKGPGYLAVPRMSHAFPERLPALLQSGLAHPFAEFGHRSRRIRDVALDPRDGQIGMRFLQPGKSLARLVDLAVLRQAGAVNAMTRGECRTLLQSFAAIFDRFGKASGEIMGN